MELLYQGKAKNVYKTDNDAVVLIEYTNKATAGNGAKASEFEQKGKINVAISDLLYQYLEKNGVKTHLISSDLEKNLQECYYCELIPLEVIIRNYAAGSMARKMGLSEGQELIHPIFELSYKDDSLGDPFINDDYATALGIVDHEQLQEIKAITLKINQLLISLFNKQNMDVIDYKIEFGKTPNGEILLIDEISPDTMRIWDKTTKAKMDKDNFRLDAGDLIENYQAVLKRLKETNV